MKYTKNPYYPVSRKTSRMSSVQSEEMFPNKEPLTSETLETLATSSVEVENFPIVLVEWVDAVCSGGTHWQSWEEIEEAVNTGPSKVRTVGMLLKNTNEYVAVCDTLIVDGDSGGYVHIIPSGMIYNLKALE